MAKKLFYKIGDACKAVDIQPYVLRYWETEFPFLNPSKSKSGQRVYSEHELDIIRRIKQLLYEEQYTTAGAKKKLEAELAEGELGGAETTSKVVSAKTRRSGSKTSSVDDTAADDTAADDTAADDAASSDAASDDAAAGGEAPATAVDAGRDIAADAAPDSASRTLADSKAHESLVALRSGVERALDEARELLARLEVDAESPRA